MSSETRPISTAQFRLAIQDLPLENIYSKAHEIENSITHLQRSNAQLKEYSDSIRQDASLSGEVREEVGDKECLEAIEENERVIERQKERVGLLKEEVERRGRVWHDGVGRNGDEAALNGVPANRPNDESGGGGGRLTDEELRRQLMDRMGDQDDDNGGAGDGMHL